MNILIIFAHPDNKNSTNAKVLRKFIEGLDKEKHTYEVLDLYELKFNPLLSDELLERKVNPDVLWYQEKIKKADMLVFISPTWWYGEPAILKGFFDRVLTSRFAFVYGKIFSFTYPKRLLKGKKAIYIKTMNSPWWWYWFGMGNWMARNVVRGTLAFCGLKVKVYRIYGIIFKSPEVLEKRLNGIKKLASKI